MNIALDFDDTYTADPMFFDSLISNAKACGHDIRFVTARSPNSKYNGDIATVSNAMDIPIIFTDMQSKQEVCEQNNFLVDIWIDDNPLGIPTRAAIKGASVGL